MTPLERAARALHDERGRLRRPDMISLPICLVFSALFDVDRSEDAMESLRQIYRTRYNELDRAT